MGKNTQVARIAARNAKLAIIAVQQKLALRVTKHAASAQVRVAANQAACLLQVQQTCAQYGVAVPAHIAKALGASNGTNTGTRSVSTVANPCATVRNWVIANPCCTHKQAMQQFSATIAKPTITRQFYIARNGS